MAVVLSDVLNAAQVTLELQAKSRDDALREIIGTMQKQMRLAEPEKFIGEVLAREQVHSTYMGSGIAFPHARTNAVQAIILGAGRSREGIVFGGKKERAHLLFVIAVPRRMVNDYLVCVGALARVMSDAANREALMQAPTPEEFIELIRAASLELK